MHAHLQAPIPDYLKQADFFREGVARVSLFAGEGGGSHVFISMWVVIWESFKFENGTCIPLSPFYPRINVKNPDPKSPS